MQIGLLQLGSAAAKLYQHVFGGIVKRLIFGLLAMAALGPGWAALGGSPGPAAGAAPATLATATGVPYSRLQRTLEGGITVSEFVDSRGVVFAVAWSGPFLPDLRALLGDAYGELVKEQAAARVRSSAFAIQRPELVILSNGRPGNFRGQAWLPGRLPTGFDPRSLP